MNPGAATVDAPKLNETDEKLPGVALTMGVKFSFLALKSNPDAVAGEQKLKPPFRNFEGIEGVAGSSKPLAEVLEVSAGFEKEKDETPTVTVGKLGPELVFEFRESKFEDCLSVDITTGGEPAY